MAPTSSGLLAHEALESNTFTRNWSGILLRGVVLVVDAKSSICSATPYQPLLREFAEIIKAHWIKNQSLNDINELHHDCMHAHDDGD